MRKKIFGLLGLVIVIAMTIFAATLPNPEALAVSSITDSVMVTIIRPDMPDVNITSPKSGSILVNPRQAIEFNYSEVDDVIVVLEKEMSSGTPQVYPVLDINAGLTPGSGTSIVDLSEPQYGYGEYTVRMRGVNPSGKFDEDSRRFSYVPVTARIEEDESTGKIYVVLDYDDSSTDLDYFVINIYNDNGKLVNELSPIVVQKGGNKKVELKFTENMVPVGEYTVATAAYDVSDAMVYNTYDIVFLYETTASPNTGGFLRGINVSRSDYLITAIIAFFVVGFFGIVFIAKNKSGG